MANIFIRSINKTIHKSSQSVLTGIIFSALIILNLYGQFLQKNTGINSFIFLIIPLLILGLQYILKCSNVKIKKSIVLVCSVLIYICSIQVFLNEFNISSIRNLLYLIIFLIAATLSNDRVWQYFIKTIYIISIIMTIDAILQVPHLISIGYRLYNARQYTMLDKPWYSLILTFAIVMMIIDFAYKNKKHMIVKIILIILLSVVNIVIIQSKAFIVCLGLGLVILIYYSNKKTRRKILNYCIPLCVIGAVFIGFNQEIIPDFIKVMANQYLGLFSTDISNYDVYAGTYSARNNIYSYSWEIFLSHPIFGVGFGNFSKYGLSLGVVEAESSILNSFVEGGIIYAVSHLALLIILLFRLLRKVKGSHKYINDMKLLVIFALYFIFNVQNDYMTAMYWVFLGIVYANTKRTEVLASI